MKFIVLVSLLFSTHVWAYLGEKFAPFTISLSINKDSHEPFILKPGDTVQITWNITTGVRLPLYGYASSRTAKTDIGLLLPDAGRTDDYIHLIDTELKLIHTNLYEWTIQNNTPTGKYHIGIGFFYHEKSPEIMIV